MVKAVLREAVLGEALLIGLCGCRQAVLYAASCQRSRQRTRGNEFATGDALERFCCVRRRA